MMSEATRAYLYRVATAVVPLLTAYGVIEDNKVPMIVAATASVLGTGLASKHTSTKG